MKSLCLSFLLLISLGSCNSDYTEETLIEDIEKLKTKKIISQFSKKRPVEAEQLTQTIINYVYVIKKCDAKRVPFNSDREGKLGKNPFKADREGYMYIDKENNYIASITYRFTTLENGRKRINFIDFRSSMGLHCIKYPLMLPIKCVDLPFSELPNVDSLKKVYPKSIFGVPFYHNLLINEDLVKSKDSILAVITFNTGNLKLKNKLPMILDSLDKYYGHSKFIFAEFKDYGEPINNIFYDPKYHPDNLMETVRSIMTNTVEGSANLIPQSSDSPFGRSVPQIEIGGVYSKPVKVSM
ncbi:MAG TPA: hypothetical protein PLY70_16520 [Saprospiraceae bacterium]|mgnify:CR=1 FL=1|nr:hypothetical protein [Saprospiraceae bacterium]HPN71174.1 hypothetical protein [Saprospiraceae bacterium]